jgi:hypothetical protein
MNTRDDSAMLAKYDNLSDIWFAMNTELNLDRDFLVVGNIPVKPNETHNLKRQKIEGGTQKYINRKKIVANENKQNIVANKQTKSKRQKNIKIK